MRAFLDELKAAISGLARVPAFTTLAVGVLALGLEGRSADEGLAILESNLR